MAKVDKIVALLEGRIARGDYTLRPIPAEVRLASETGVSRMTARKAILRLVEEGLLSRAPNGRLVVLSPRATSGGGAGKSKTPAGRARTPRPAAMRIGFVAPAYGSAEIERWRVGVERAVELAGGRIRPVSFHHWDDPILTEATQSLDAMFLVPPAEPIPDAVATRLRRGPARIVALDCDLTPHGIRSVNLTPPSAVVRLLEHLVALGHRTIDCFNSQPIDSVVEQRIAEWQQWRAMPGVAGNLLNHPDTSYGDPPKHAFEAMRRRLGRAASPAKPEATAILCVTMPGALGVMRALHEHGLRVGRDVSVCAVNDEGLSAYLCPSLTSTQMPDPLPYLGAALKWMAGASDPAPTLTQPSEVPLFVGESTGPVRASTIVRRRRRSSAPRRSID